MEIKKIFVKLDVKGTIKQIKKINTENDLYAYSRKLRMYYDSGLITISPDIRDAMNDKLDEIYRKQ